MGIVSGSGVMVRGRAIATASALVVGGSILLVVQGCSNSRSAGDTPSSRADNRYGVSASPRVVGDSRPIGKGGGTYKIGNPYQIAGRWYVPRAEPNLDQTGVASWYGADFHGRKTANGEVFDMNAITAAHPTLPIPSYVYVTNLSNGRTILLRVNDRGPYARDRIIDLSRRSAQLLGYEQNGLARVRVRYAGPAPLDGNDSTERRYLASNGSGW